MDSPSLEVLTERVGNLVEKLSDLETALRRDLEQAREEIDDIRSNQRWAWRTIAATIIAAFATNIIPRLGS